MARGILNGCHSKYFKALHKDKVVSTFSVFPQRCAFSSLSTSKCVSLLTSDVLSVFKSSLELLRLRYGNGQSTL